MKLTHLTVSNFLGARAVDVKLGKPIALFAGKNYAGKSSIQEAVRMALTGESVRVGLKKDYSALVSEGQESGFVEVDTEDWKFSAILPSGKGAHSDLPAIPYVLDAQRFARLDTNERRAFLFGLMNLKTDGPAVKDRLTKRGCEPAKIEAAMPLLRAGFAAACEEAKGKARDAKAAWRTVTGETYGDKKAASFRLDKPEVDTAKLERATADIATIEQEIEDATAKLGDLQGRARQAAEQESKLTGLRQQASLFARIQEKLNIDEAELKQWEEKVEAARPKAQGTKAEPCACPECGALLLWRNGELVPRETEKTADTEAADKLPEYENALRLMQSAVANDKRDIVAADSAARALRELEEAGLIEAPSESEINTLKTRIETMKASRKEQQASIADMQDAERRAEHADKKTNDAARYHADVQAWGAIGDALAPDGIPGEMLAEALGPINARLEQSAADAEWPRMMIDTDMSILNLHKDRPPRTYALLSESEQWRADAMIAEAIAHLSGVRILVLDRLDVLDLKGREDLLYWLDGMAEGGEIDSALIFGTLKALPSKLPETVASFWIENGVAGKIEVAA